MGELIRVGESEVGSVRRPSGGVVPTGDDGLTDLQRQFVDHYCALGGDGTAAAIAAGYGGGAKNMATRNLLKPKIQAEIERRVRMGRGSALLTATNRLFQIIEGSDDERAVVQAALGVMDRFGMAPPKGPAVAVQVNNISGTEAQGILKDVQEARARRLGTQSSTSTTIIIDSEGA